MRKTKHIKLLIKKFWHSQVIEIANTQKFLYFIENITYKDLKDFCKFYKDLKEWILRYLQVRNESLKFFECLSKSVDIINNWQKLLCEKIYKISK